MNVDSLSNVVLIDDDREALLSLVRALKSVLPDIQMHAASTVEVAIEMTTAIAPQCIVLDLSLDPAQGVESGFALLALIMRQDPSVRIIVLTGHGTLQHGVRALNSGAANFLEKPADITHLAALIRDGCTQSNLRREHKRILSERSDEVESLIIGNSPAVCKVHDAVRYAARTAQPVLIVGETGTGKGLCAQAIHLASGRRAAHFVRYQPNFGTADLVNSDLFGHQKGAFTGANDERRGLLSEAHRGTLFLDEIEELPIETQVTLLGVLQEHKFRPLGATKEQEVDARVICASNSDVERDMASGKLRRDFYHRIAHFVIALPALRERRSDIPAIAQHALVGLSTRDRVNVFEFDPRALELLQGHIWPGNVRELQAVVESAMYRAQFAERSTILTADLNLGLIPRSGIVSGLSEQLEEFRQKLIDEALARNGNNQVQAARELGIDRSSMRRMIQRTG